MERVSPTDEGLVMPMQLLPGGNVSDGQPAIVEVGGVVVDLDEHVATIELGDAHDEWVFPRSMLPAGVAIDSVLTFDRARSDAVVLDHRAPAPSVGDRLGRALNRRRLDLG